MITAGCLPSPHRQQKELFSIHYSETEPHKDFVNLVWVLTMRCFLSVTLHDNLSIDSMNNKTTFLNATLGYLGKLTQTNTDVGQS